MNPAYRIHLPVVLGSVCVSVRDEGKVKILSKRNALHWQWERWILLWSEEALAETPDASEVLWYCPRTRLVASYRAGRVKPWLVVAEDPKIAIAAARAKKSLAVRKKNRESKALIKWIAKWRPYKERL